MEEYRNQDVTVEDEAVLEAEESADQGEVMGLDDEPDVEAVSDVETASAEETAEIDDAEAEAAETDDTEPVAEAAEDETDRNETVGDTSLEEPDQAAEESDQAAEESDDSVVAPEDESQEQAAAGGKGRKPQLVTVVGVRFRTAGKAYYFSPGEYKVRHSMHVIVETARGVEYGTVVTMPMELDRRKIKSPLKEILRPATPEDDATHIENRRKEREAYKVCFRKIRERGLDMKLIDAEYTFDHSKILFYFTADGRIDFRDLVKDLAGIFKTRIELRQIGVRDETKILGGYGSCGRPLCCHTYLSDFVPVSIKMAKEQNLSLNPTKISGVCGRLMCCLKNEQETYEELNKNLPRQGDEVEGPDGLQGEVESVNVLRQKVRILVEIDDEKEIHEYNADEITMIRRRKRGEAKHRSKRIENGQEGADDLKKASRKGARPDRVVRADDAERGNRSADGERPARDGNRDRDERPARENNRDNGERQNRGGNAERRGRENNRDHERSGQNENNGQERKERRRSDGRRGGRGSREDRQNMARERGSREDRQNNAARERGERENTGVESTHGGEGNGQERQNGGRNRHRRGGRGRGERQGGQNQNGGQGQNGGQSPAGGSNES